MIFLIFFLTAIALISGIYLYNKNKKVKEPIYEEMISIKGWVLLTTLIIAAIIYILQQLKIM